MEKKSKRERYSIIISSLTDARKRSFVLSITKRTLIFVICAMLIIVTASAAAAVLTSSQAISSLVQAEALKTQCDNQVVLLDVYSEQITQLKQFRYLNGIDSSGIKEVQRETAPLNQSLPEAEEAAQSPSGGTHEENVLLPSYSGGSVGISSFDKSILKSIPMTEAIEQINNSFQASIDARIKEIKASEGFDKAEVIYNGDEDGDSDVINNWADVLSIYAVTTMRDELKFMTIRPDNVKLLSDIYNEMNQVSFTTKTTPYTTQNAGDGTENITGFSLTIYVTIDNLTYTEGAKLHKFSRKQTQKLKQLMSPSYYTYFADLLGLDVYDGMRSEELEKIISGLEDGTKGSEIVKTALIRLGHPYSNAKRGRGNYVDCSYFSYWVYDQAGIKIPTSSVEQAKYCYNNDYVIEKKDLKPGDLIFWSKTTCNCGRWREIHHVAVYIGNNKTIEASSRRGRVVIRDFWSGREWKYAFCARPYSEDSGTGAAAQ